MDQPIARGSARLADRPEGAPPLRRSLRRAIARAAPAPPTAWALAFVGGLAVVALVTAQPLPPPPPEMPRGELLYTTHCIGCHSTQVHWRDKKLATDWGKLLAQVQRWQANVKLGWSEDEIFEVARYLNALFYRLPMPAEKTIGPGAVPERVVMRN